MGKLMIGIGIPSFIVGVLSFLFDLTDYRNIIYITLSLIFVAICYVEYKLALFKENR